MSSMNSPLSMLPCISPTTLKNQTRWFPQCSRAKFRPKLIDPTRLASRRRLEALPSHQRRPGNLRAKKSPLKMEESSSNDGPSDKREDDEVIGADIEDCTWSNDEIDAISALFNRRIPQKPMKPAKERALPLPLPYKTRPAGVPTPKHHIRLAARHTLSSRSSFGDQVYKNPEVLINIAREIGDLPPETNVSAVLDRWARFLRKGSLSMTIRELGHMGVPERALQTLCWAQKQKTPFFPDDQILASTVEVLARFGQLRMEPELENCLNSASRTVLEAIVRGFIRAGNLNLACKVLLFANDSSRTLAPSIYAKLILEAGKTPDGYKLASALLDELGERESLDLTPQDCTAVMKVCVKLGRFGTVESLFDWFKESGRSPTVVMYTTVIHSRYCGKRYREGLALVWEMEGQDYLLDLPAYRVVIRLCVALNDLGRASRYFSRLKEAGFVPTYDIYHDMIKGYAGSGRLAKLRQLCKEAELAGLKLDRDIVLARLVK